MRLSLTLTTLNNSNKAICNVQMAPGTSEMSTVAQVCITSIELLWTSIDYLREAPFKDIEITLILMFQ